MVQPVESEHLTPPEGGNSYLVAVDGSEASEMAFTIGLNGLFRSNLDLFNVCTITDSKKENLPFQYKPDYIEDKYTAKIYGIAQQHGTAKFIRREKEEGKTTKETLWGVAQEYKSTIMITGMHGRKGPKADFTIAGSAVQYLAQQPITVAIIKDARMRQAERNSSFRFGVLFDGSACAQKVLRQTMSMMAPQDRLTTISVSEPGMDPTVVEPKIGQICGEFGRAHDSVFLQTEPNQLIKDRIKQYLVEQGNNDEYVDFVCVGNRGINVGNAVDGEDYLGRVARAMIGTRNLNVIFVP